MIVVLCHPSDVVPAPDARERWVEFFVPGGSDPSNLSRYLRDLSAGKYDVDAIEVTEWLDVGHSTAEAAQYGGIDQRRVLEQWGQEAMEAAGIEAQPQTVFAYNIDADHGSVGGGRIVLAYSETRAFEPTFMVHEVGHALGLDHSRSDTEGDYGDRADIMSAMSVWTFRDEWGRATGPAMAAINLEQLGWLGDSPIDYRELVTTEGLGGLGTGDNFTLAPLYSPPDLAPELPRVTVFAVNGQALYLEYRDQVGWDRGFPGPRLLVHRADGVIPVILGGGDAPTGALAPGQRLQLSDQPCPWGFIFHSIRDDSCAEVGLWVDYM